MISTAKTIERMGGGAMFTVAVAARPESRRLRTYGHIGSTIFACTMPQIWTETT